MLEILLILIFIALIFGPYTLDILLRLFVMALGLAIIAIIIGVILAIVVGVYYLFTV